MPKRGVYVLEIQNACGIRAKKVSRMANFCKLERKDEADGATFPQSLISNPTSAYTPANQDDPRA